LQARLEQEMRQRQELEAEQQRIAAQLEAERAEWQAQAQRLTDITEFLQGLGQCVGFSLPAGLLVPPLPPHPVAAATPVSMKVFYFRLCFACMASTFLH
jgi:uncharacterized membrane protein YccC